MHHVELTPSEASYVELALKVKEKQIRRAHKLLAKAEAILEDAVGSVLERAGVEQLPGPPRIVFGTGGRPAQIVWHDRSFNGNGTHSRIGDIEADELETEEHGEV